MRQTETYNDNIPGGPVLDGPTGVLSAGPASAEPVPGQVPARFVFTDEAGREAFVELRVDHLRYMPDGETGSVVEVIPYGTCDGALISVSGPKDLETATVTIINRRTGLRVPLASASKDHEVTDLLRAWTIWADTLGLDQLLEMPDGSVQSVIRPRRASVVRRPAPRRVNPHFRTRRPSAIGTRGHCAAPNVLPLAR